MRPVSIEDFIEVVFECDNSPPTPSTIRRLCTAKNEFGLTVISYALKLWKVWKIDIDGFFRKIERRVPCRVRNYG